MGEDNISEIKYEKYVIVDGHAYTAEVVGTLKDYDWDERQSKTIYLTGLTYDQVKELFVDGRGWSILIKTTTIYEDGHQDVNLEEFDNGGYCFAGAITDFRDGRVSIKMGMETELEQAYKLLLGDN